MPLSPEICICCAGCLSIEELCFSTVCSLFCWCEFVAIVPGRFLAAGMDEFTILYRVEFVVVFLMGVITCFFWEACCFMSSALTSSALAFLVLPTLRAFGDTLKDEGFPKILSVRFILPLMSYLLLMASLRWPGLRFWFLVEWI